MPVRRLQLQNFLSRYQYELNQPCPVRVRTVEAAAFKRRCLPATLATDSSAIAFDPG